jgi:hypothetical protein
VGVGEGDAGAAVGDAADGLVAEVREHEEANLPNRVKPTVGETVSDFL